MAKDKEIDPIDAHAGSKLRERRELMNLNMSDLGKQLSPPKTGQQIQKYETGYNRMGFSILYKLSNILEVTPNYFAEGLDDKEQVTVKPAFPKETKSLVKHFSNIPSAAMRKNILIFVKNIAADLKNTEGKSNE